MRCARPWHGVGDAMRSRHSRSLETRLDKDRCDANQGGVPAISLRGSQAKQRIARPVTWASG